MRFISATRETVKAEWVKQVTLAVLFEDEKKPAVWSVQVNNKAKDYADET